MKRRDGPRRFKLGEEQRQQGETWSQWLRRIYPKEIAAARRRRDREILEWRWPRVSTVKGEYHRRRR